jgi:hypothetical protein
MLCCMHHADNDSIYKARLHAAHDTHDTTKPSHSTTPLPQHVTAAAVIAAIHTCRHPFPNVVFQLWLSPK